jgi:hypothetical protein
MLGTTWHGLSNSQGHNILEGESPLSAVPTATLFCTRACRVYRLQMFKLVWVVVLNLPNFLSCSVLFCLADKLNFNP